MKPSCKTEIFFGALGVLAVMLLVWQAFAGQEGVANTIAHATVSLKDSGNLKSSLTLPAEVVSVELQYQGGTFWTESRKEKIERYQCTQCHNDKPVEIADAAQMAHGDIALDHGGVNTPLSCFTCHHVEDRDALINEQGERIDINHAYQLCGQCHFRQKKDWVGGAHGKRVRFWAGQRVVKNCTACHDPHSPLFEKRWPKTYSPPNQ